MNTEQEQKTADQQLCLCAVVDQQCGQRYTLFTSFLNLYIATGNKFYAGCASTFVYGASSRT